jgi:PAS domain-containing protein
MQFRSIFSETENRAYLLAVCLLCSLLTLLVAYIRPAADQPAENLTNRGIGVAVAFVITFILIVKSRIVEQLKERNRQLAEAYRKLEDEVAQRRRTEEELFASRERFLVMVECAAEGIYITLDGAITYANPAFCALTGYSEKDIVG